MDSFSKIRTQHVELEKPDILQAIRQALIAGQQARKVAVDDGCSSEPSQSEPEELNSLLTTRPAVSSEEELHLAPRIAGEGDSAGTGLDDAPLADIAFSSEELHDAPTIASNDESVGEELEEAPPLTQRPLEAIERKLPDAPSIAILQLSIDSTLRPTGSRDVKAPVESPPDPTGQPSVVRGDANSDDDRLFTRSTFRIVTRGTVLIVAIGLAFALLPIGPTDLPRAPSIADLTAQTNQSAERPRQEGSIATPLSEVAALRRQVEELAAKQGQVTEGIRQEQLKAMASDVAALRRGLEKLTTKQDEMAAEIAQLQAAKKNPTKRVRSRR